MTNRPEGGGDDDGPGCGRTRGGARGAHSRTDGDRNWRLVRCRCEGSAVLAGETRAVAVNYYSEFGAAEAGVLSGPMPCPIIARRRSVETGSWPPPLPRTVKMQWRSLPPPPGNVGSTEEPLTGDRSAAIAEHLRLIRFAFVVSMQAPAPRPRGRSCVHIQT
jgi:hypothetical protein